MSETNFAIHLDFEFLQDPKYRKKGYGAIWVELNGLQFPEVNWPDFAVSGIAGLNRGLLRGLRGDPEPFHLIFMDGPFHIRFRYENQDIWCTMVNGSILSESEIVLQVLIPRATFYPEIKRTNLEILEMAQENGIVFENWMQSWEELREFFADESGM
jgi:hypothetical protein